MTIEYAIFDAVNGLAGRFALLDAVGRLLTVFGLLAVLLATLLPLWHPARDAAARRRYLWALLATAALCAALIGLELLLMHIIGRELRSRPANARWTTMLITPSTTLAFPCWPVALSAAASVLLALRFRRAGVASLLLTALQAVAFVFVGAHYPFDVLTGAFLGMIIGQSGAVLARLTPGLRARPLLPAFAALAVWLALMAIAVKPASALDTGMVPAMAGSMPAPPAGAPFTIAGNGHLTAGWLRVEVDTDTATLRAVEARAREEINRAFRAHPEMYLLTLTVTGRFRYESHARVGTLYTATVDRADWPRRGFVASERLPGLKFVHPRLAR
ncbi:MAG: Undecaprenyl-diphosphatase BcrC [bacterium ADurb.Bin429]|nr:MAG: Undecaprenyl-diphosphatase BcrC [bacterium ADurb.Bin429]